MEYIRCLFLEKFKKLLYICVGLTCLFYIYCFPVSIDEILSIIKGGLMYIGFALFMYFSVCVNCFTGAYEILNKVPSIRYSVFIMLGSIFIALLILGFIGTIITRNFEIFPFTIPALIGAYIGCKSVDYINKKESQ